MTRNISTLHSVGSAKCSSEEHPVKNREPPFVFFETLVSLVVASLTSEGIYYKYLRVLYNYLERERLRPWERDIKAPVLQSDL